MKSVEEGKGEIGMKSGYVGIFNNSDNESPSYNAAEEKRQSYFFCWFLFVRFSFICCVVLFHGHSCACAIDTGALSMLIKHYPVGNSGILLCRL